MHSTSGKSKEENGKIKYGILSENKMSEMDSSSDWEEEKFINSDCKGELK